MVTTKGSPVALVGRHEIMMQIRSVVDSAHLGLSGTIVLSGPPGIGKSAILEVTRHEAVDCLVVVARGIQSESELAYASLQQLLQPLARLTGALPPVQRQALESALGMGEGSSEPMLVGLGVLGVLAEAAEQQTVLCLLDDVQWFDSASRRALAFAARRMGAERIAVISAHRIPADSSRFTHEFGVEDLRIPPLAEGEEAELLTQILGGQVTSDIVRSIRESTAGFPLATVALAKSLTRDQLLGHEPLPKPLPIGAELREVFDQDLSGLPHEARQLLLVASSDDSGMAGPVVRAATHLGVGPAMIGLLERADLLTLEHGSIEFRHPLVRSVVYQSAATEDRRAAHNALATAYAEAGDRERQIWHLALGAIPPAQGLAEELAELGRTSALRSAYGAASAAFELAADLTGQRDHRAQMLVAGARSAWKAGKLDHARAMAEEARPLSADPRMLYEVDFVRGGIHLSQGHTDSAYEILFEGGQRIVASDVDSAIRMWALASEGVSFAGNRVAARQLADVAETVDTPERDHLQKMYLKMIRGLGHLFGDDVESAAAQFRLALVQADSVSEVNDLAAAARVAMYLGDDAQSIQLGVRAVEKAKADGSVGFIPMAGGRLALLEVMTGEFTLALATADEIIRLAADTSQAELGVQCLCWSGLVMAYRGKEHECRMLVDRARKDSEGSPLGSVADALNWVEGALDLSMGRMEAASRHFAKLDHPGIRIMAGLDAIEAAQFTGRHGEFVEIAETFASATDEPWARARAAHGRALMSSGPEAEDFYQDALSYHARSSRPFERARSQLAYGSWLRRNRRRRDAREQLQDAFLVFDALAASPWVERAQVEIRASGGTSRRRDTLTYDRLTPQEVQVARLVTEGMTNREAASHLFLSHRTVDHHLRNIYVKLGVTSRTELARLRLDEEDSVA